VDCLKYQTVGPREHIGPRCGAPGVPPPLSVGLPNADTCQKCTSHLAVIMSVQYCLNIAAIHHITQRI